MFHHNLKDSKEYLASINRVVERGERVYKQLHPDPGLISGERRSMAELEYGGIARLTMSGIDSDKIESGTGLGGVRVPLVNLNDEGSDMWLIIEKQSKYSVRQQLAEITDFLLNLKSFSPIERQSFKSIFLEISESRFGGFFRLSAIHPEEGLHILAVNIVKEINMVVKSVIRLILKRKQSMISAGIFNQELNYNRLVSSFRVLLTKRLGEKVIQEAAYNNSTYGPSTQTSADLSSNVLLDELNADLAKFASVKSNNFEDLSEGINNQLKSMRNIKPRKQSVLTRSFLGQEYVTYQQPASPIETHNFIPLIDEDQLEAQTILGLGTVPDHCKFKKEDEPILKAHSVYIHSQWIEPALIDLAKEGKSRYLQRLQPVKPDVDKLIASSDKLHKVEDYFTGKDIPDSTPKVDFTESTPTPIPQTSNDTKTINQNNNHVEKANATETSYAVDCEIRKRELIVMYDKILKSVYKDKADDEKGCENVEKLKNRNSILNGTDIEVNSNDIITSCSEDANILETQVELAVSDPKPSPSKTTNRDIKDVQESKVNIAQENGSSKKAKWIIEKVQLPPADDLQVSLEDIWCRLKFSPQQRIEMAVKYASHLNKNEVEKSIMLWKKVTELILARESQIVELLKRSVGKGERAFPKSSLDEEVRRSRYIALNSSRVAIQKIAKEIERKFNQKVIYNEHDYLMKMKGDFPSLG